MSTVELLKKYGVRPRKGLGQHFLVNEAVARRMAEAILPFEGIVVEIGPGLGSLTRWLLEGGGRVVAVEIDPGLCRILREELGHHPLLTVHEGDFLSTNLSSMGDQLVVVGNLPYKITGPVVEKMIQNRRRLRSGLIMVQREVAQRMVSPPGRKSYGPLSIAVQLYFRPRMLFSVGPGSFFPRPKVSSAIVELAVLSPPSVQVEDAVIFFALVKAGFGQRRKILKNALLSTGFFSSSEDVIAALTKVGIDHLRRAETLSLDEFARLSRLVEGRHPGHSRNSDETAFTAK